VKPVDLLHTALTSLVRATAFELAGNHHAAATARMNHHEYMQLFYKATEKRNRKKLALQVFGREINI
jgi:hypothetical protein